MSVPPANQSGYVVCIGRAALDTIVHVPSLPPEDGRVVAHEAVVAGGGPAATAAVTLSRLGVSVMFVGAVGDDEAGALIRRGLEREGVEVSRLVTVRGARSPVTAGLVRMGAANTRALAVDLGTCSSLGAPSRELADLVAAALWVHVDDSGWPLVRTLRTAGVATPVSVDGGNPLAGLDLRLADLYVPGAGELLRWTGCADLELALERAIREGARVAIATEGEAGSRARSTIDPDVPDLTSMLRARRAPSPRAQRYSHHAPAFPIPVRVSATVPSSAGGGSTLGAGDVYHGALVAGLARGRSLAASMDLASVAAALSCRALDGRSGIPGLADVDALLTLRSDGGRVVAGASA